MRNETRLPRDREGEMLGLSAPHPNHFQASAGALCPSTEGQHSECAHHLLESFPHPKHTPRFPSEPALSGPEGSSTSSYPPELVLTAPSLEVMTEIAPPPALHPAERVRDRGPGRRTGAPAFQSRGVLLVDDELENLYVLEAILDDSYRVFLAESGAKALEFLERNGPVDLIVTDQRMPGLTGVQLLEMVASRWPEMVRVVLTGYTDLQPMLEAVNTGQVFRFLLKPFDPTEIRMLVMEVMDRLRQRFELSQLVEELSSQKALLESSLANLERLQSQFLQSERAAFLGRFAAGLLREFNAHSSCFAPLLKALAAPTVSPQILERARDIANHHASLVAHARRMKEFGQALGSPLRRVPISPAVFLAGTVGFFRMQEARKAHHIEVQVSELEPPIYVDAARVETALFALLRNAVKAAGPDGRVTVSLKRLREEFIICVSDTGPGVAADVIRLVMLHSLRTVGLTEGLGLGLSLACHVAAEHEGRVLIDCGEDRDTQVMLCLPEASS